MDTRCRTGRADVERIMIHAMHPLTIAVDAAAEVARSGNPSDRHVHTSFVGACVSACSERELA